MSTLACALLRHDTRDRWIGDLRAVFCVTCDCLIVPGTGDPHEAPSVTTARRAPDPGPSPRATRIPGARRAAVAAVTG